VAPRLHLELAALCALTRFRYNDAHGAYERSMDVRYCTGGSG
jgi:hypothetical protein